MIRNCYKRDDVFACRHETHRNFDHRVSAHHVLIEKRCFPEGCIDFLWKCKLLGKGGSCPKGYRHVGSNCTHCRHYDEEKLQRRPVLLLSEAEYAEFREECRRFEEWVAALAHRPVEVGGEISDLRPYLLGETEETRTRLLLRGFLARLTAAFVGLDGLSDALFVRISRSQQQRHRLAVGDRIEALGFVALDRGRLVARELRSLRIEARGGNPPPGWDRALLDRSRAVRIEGQPERCLRCERGALVDIRTAGRSGRARRELLCLEGIGRPHDCPYEALRGLGAGATCAPPTRIS